MVYRSRGRADPDWVESGLTNWPLWESTLPRPHTQMVTRFV
jgi:hypothetical protein